MNKKGFTLIEVIVSIVLVSLVLISLMATLIKLRETYSVVHDDSDVLVYSSSASRVINNDLMDNNGIRYVSCDTSGVRCEFVLGNDEKRSLEIISEDIERGQEINSKGNEVIHTTRKTTLKYANITDEEEKLIYMKTMNLEDYDEQGGVRTTSGYNFYSINVDSANYDNIENNEYSDVVTKVTITIYDGKDINDGKYDIVLYTAMKYNSNEYLGQKFEIEFDNQDADKVYEYGMDEVFGVGYYKSKKETTKANKLTKITPPKKKGEAFLGYYYKPYGTSIEIEVIDSMGNIVASPRLFKNSVLLQKAEGEEVNEWVRARWGACEGPGYKYDEEKEECIPNTFDMKILGNGGVVNEQIVGARYQTLLPSININPRRKGYAFLGLAERNSLKTYYDSESKPLGVYDLKENSDMLAQWQKCSVGYYSALTDVNCTKCPEGYDKTDAEVDADSKKSCYMDVGKGQKLDKEKSFPEDCLPGTYSNETKKVYFGQDKKCKKCGSGTYQENYGKTGCEPCKVGHHSSEGASKCDANTYTVEFNNNTGNGTMSNQKFTYGQKQNLKANTFTKAGYKFAGWNTKANGSGNNYADKADGSNFVVNHRDNVTLYAQWTAIKYTVKYEKNGGTGSMVPSTHTYGTASTLSPNTFTREGYKFTGWKDASGNSYADRASVSTPTVAGGTLTLYAQWTGITYYVKYNANGGTGTMANSTHQYGKSSNLRANSFQRGSYYVFDGWSTVANGPVVYNNNASISNLAKVNGQTIIYMLIGNLVQIL